MNQPMIDRLWSKVQQETYLVRSRRQVVQNLTLGMWRECFSSFYFDDYQTIDKKVYSLPRNMPALIRNAERKLPAYRMAAVAQLQLQATTIRALSKAVAVVVVNCTECIRDRANAWIRSC